MEIKHTAITRKNGLIRFFTPFIAGMFLSMPLLALPPDFNATYQIETYGIVAAQATYSLTREDQSLNFSQHSKAVGIASLFRRDTLHENSLMSLHDGQLLLEKYSFIQRGSDRNRDIHLAINWKHSDSHGLSGEISGTVSDNEVNNTVQHPVWDTLSFQIPMMMQPPSGTSAQQHTILVKGELKEYSFISHGKETIDVAGNTMETVKIEKNSGNSDKPFYFWIAPELHNLPVRIEKWKNGKPHITMSLSQARFPANQTLRFDAHNNFDDFDDI